MESQYIYVNFYNKEEIKENDIIFSEKEKEKPECIYSSEIKMNNTYIYRKIFKTPKRKTHSFFDFEINDSKYIVTFKSKIFIPNFLKIIQTKNP